MKLDNKPHGADLHQWNQNKPGLDFERTGTSPAQADAAYYSFIKASGDGVQNKQIQIG